jgi:nitrogen fixation protein FixH
MTARITGRQVLLMIVAFFGVDVAVNTYFVFAAVNTFRGEDAPGAYLQGLDYNQTLAARTAQARLGWRATIQASRNGSGITIIDVTVVDRDGATISTLSPTGMLQHPSDAHQDRAMTFHPAGDGAYATTLHDVAPGHWNIVIRAKAEDGTPFEARRQVWLH